VHAPQRGDASRPYQPCAEEETQMVRKLLQTLVLVLAVLFLVSTVALAAEMTCTVAEANGCTMAKGGDGKESKVTAPGVKVGDKINCDDKGTCTKKLLQ
jgi:hypothetical protein